MKTILVRVTREDIRKGLKGDPDCCPVAIAIRRHKKFRRCEAYTSYAELKGVCSNWPKGVEPFIRAFDKGKPVKPFSFRLKVP